MKNSISIIFDEWLLRLTEIIAKYIYCFIGLNNFRLANILYITGFASEITSCFIMSQINSIIQTVISVILITIIGVLLWQVYVIKPSRLYKTGFRNYARISFAFLNRVSSLCLFCILFWIFVPEIRQTLILADYFLDFGYLLTVIAYYFASIEPENPTDSWVKKKWNSFKRLFERSPIAQPV